MSINGNDNITKIHAALLIVPMVKMEQKITII